MRRTNTAVWMEKQKRWQIQVQKDNIRKAFYSSTPGRTGQREANAKADAWLDNNVSDVKKKVSAAAEEYLEQLKITTSKSHYEQYSSYFRNWIIPKIGNVRVQNVNEQHLQNIINEASAKGLSYKTLCNIRSCAQAWLKFCRKSKYSTLFVEGLTIPKSAPKGERKILHPKDVEILFSTYKTLHRGKEVFDLYIHAYRFQVLTGLRPGELVGIKKADINGKTVNLQRSIDKYGEITGGKNDNAKRRFKLTDGAFNTLTEQYKMLEENNIESEYIFPTKYGEPMKEKHYYERWCAYRDYNGISAPVTLYEMRHTFVSIAKTLPEGYLKQLVGHSKNMDTYGVYSHELEDDLDKTAELIQGIFNNYIP